MTGVADDGQVWNAATQFDGNMPLRQVAVELLVVAAETAVNGSQAFQSGIIDALHGTYP